MKKLELKNQDTLDSVSYTHLDVYKRQERERERERERVSERETETETERD